MAYENILVETRGRVGIITLNRPKALNALCAALIDELGQALDVFEADDNIGCMILTGSEKAFAAGADIKEMVDRTYMDVYRDDFITEGWERIAQTRKPVIAAVNAVIAFYYYARVIKSVWLDDPTREFADDVESEPAGSLKLALGMAVVLTLAIGIYPTIATFVREAAQVLATGS